MKKLLLATLFFSSLAQAQVYTQNKNCDFNIQGNHVYVVPHYKAIVNFVFPKNEEGFAQVNWKLDANRTRECFKIAQGEYPALKPLIPRVQMNDLMVSVLGGLDSKRMSVFEESTGHWNGQSDLIRIPLSEKKNIEAALKRGEKIIEIDGDLRMKMIAIKREKVAELQCTQNGVMQAGVMNLLNRMNAMNAEASKRPIAENINMEEVLQDFIDECVEFENVEAKSLVEFGEKQRLKSMILPKEFSILGDISRFMTTPIPTVSTVEATILNLKE